MATVLRRVTRKRPLDLTASCQDEAEMEKCLTTVDLVSLGVGSCCGAGMYLTAGIIAAKKAGPGGIISIILAGLGSILTGVHYAELAGICPNTSGSAYMYTYVTIGELWAFIIGWGLIVEYVIGTAAASVALSETFHSITEKKISGFLNSCMASAGLPHIDFVAALVCLLLMWLLASGVQMSARVNNVLNGLNSVVWAVFVGASLYLGSSSNWSQHGGFLPYGYQGVFTAVPTAFYAFIGFDGLATTGAECRTPARSIPISIVLSILINILIFTCVVAGLTFNMPFNLLPVDTAMLDVFAINGYPALKYIMGVGAVAGLFAATFGSLFPLPRVLQAMAHDGLLFRYFSLVCPKRHTALRATITSGLVAAFLAAFVNLTLLIELVLIGTLLAYVIVTYATLIIRYVDLYSAPLYKPIPVKFQTSVSESSSHHDSYLTCLPGIKRKTSDTDLHVNQTTDGSCLSFSRQSSHSESSSKEVGGVINPAYQPEGASACSRRDSSSSLSKRHEDDHNDSGHFLKNSEEKSSLLEVYTQFPKHDKPICNKQPQCSKCTRLTLYVSQHIYVFLFALYASIFLCCGIVANLYQFILDKNILVICILCLLVVTMTTLAVILMLLPHSKIKHEGFRAPFVPLITVFTASINLYLMTSLHWITWLLFLVWMAIGLVLYFLYGIKNSSLIVKREEDWEDPEGEADSADTVIPVPTNDVTQPLLQ